MCCEQHDFHEVLAGFGANLGNGVETFREVKARFETTFGTVQASSLLRTKAETLNDAVEPDYWNAVLHFRVPKTWNPPRLLKWLLNLEKELGRVRTGFWSSRTVDLDLLLWDELFLDAAPELILPHPMIPWRSFVLVPACEIVPDRVHPLTGLSLREMLENCQKGENSPLIWESMEALPEELLCEGRRTHRPILARRWVCRNGEGPEVFEEIKRRSTRQNTR